MFKSNLIILSFFYLISFDIQGQISGRIVDDETELPIIGVSVQNSNRGTFSDSSGYFLIEGSKDDTLIFRHTAYQSMYYRISNSTIVLRINLIPEKKSIDQVVVFAPFFHQSLVETPTSFTLLQKEILEINHATDYADILNLVPGIYVHSGSPGTKRITIRGIGSRIPYGTNRIKAYINYIPLTSTDGTTSIEDIEISLFNRIEIIKGAKSAFYNSGLGGIIQFYTPDQFKSGQHRTIKSEIGSFGTYRQIGQYSFSNNKMNTAIYLSRNKTRGYRQNSKTIQNNILLTASIKSKEKHNLNMLFHVADVMAQIPSSIDLDTYLNYPESAALNWLRVKGFEKYSKINTGVRHVYRISEKLSFQNLGYINYLNSYESRPFNILDDNSIRYGLKSYVMLNANKFKIQSGLDFMFEKYDWSVYETDLGKIGQIQTNNNENRKNINAFLHLDLKATNSLRFESGINFNKTSYLLNDLISDSVDYSGSYAFKNVFSPFFGFNLQIAPSIYAYASISHGFSFPTVEETLLPDGMINTALKPESGKNLDFGIRISPVSLKCFIDLNYYIIKVNNLLTTKRVTEEIFMGQNAGSSLHQGVELAATLNLNENHNLKIPGIYFRGTWTLSANRFLDFIDDQNDFSGNTLPGTPNQIFTLNLQLTNKKGIYLNAQFRYTGEQYLTDDNTQKIDSYEILDIKTGFKANLSKSNIHLNLYLGIDNMLNEKYASMLLINAPQSGSNSPRYFYPGLPRNIYSGVILNF